VPATGFIPSRHGFHFANAFGGKVVIVPGFGQVATRGRGGGMAFAALDYWYTGLPVPTHRPQDFQSAGVPEDGTRLADYLYKRLFDSFATASARQFVSWTLAADQPTWADPGVLARTREETLPRLRHSIEAGRPAVLGLVAAATLEDLACNHQVVAYGYEEGTAGVTRIRVYDPDLPEQEVVLSVDPDRSLLESSVPGECWRGCFVQDYVPERPSYLDLGVSRGIWVSSWTPTLGRHFVAQYSARNYGEHRARLAELFMVVRGPGGERHDGLLGGDGDPTPLEPGAERALFKAVVRFGTVPGCYELTAAYRSEHGALIALPPAEPGTSNQVGVTAVAPPRPARVTVTFTYVTVEDADALAGRLSLGLAVNGQSSQWPEVGAMEVGDGKTFDVGERFELVLEPHEPLTVTVAGAGAGGESGGVVCERWLGLDGWGAGVHGYRSRTPLRDAPSGTSWAEGAYTVNFLIETTELAEEDRP
jgi:hypothetical protein